MMFVAVVPSKSKMSGLAPILPAKTVTASSFVGVKAPLLSFRRRPDDLLL